MFLFRKPLFTVIMVLKRKSRDVGSASKSKRIRDVLSIIEKVKILDMMEIETKFLDLRPTTPKHEMFYHFKSHLSM